jgi:hypothetical protein
VTFLSLPGLDSVARTAGMVAVVFATFSLVATGVAILRHKADLERPISHVGIEGLMVISVRKFACCGCAAILTYLLLTEANGCAFSADGVPRLCAHRFPDWPHSIHVSRRPTWKPWIEDLFRGLCEVDHSWRRWRACRDSDNFVVGPSMITVPSLFHVHDFTSFNVHM